jgi:hypothetical protein
MSLIAESQESRPQLFSAVEVPGLLPVPGMTVMMEAWVYAS